VVLFGMLGEPDAAVADTYHVQQRATAGRHDGFRQPVCPLSPHAAIVSGTGGLVPNQPADDLLDAADLVVTIGYDPIEYDEASWNAGRSGNIHIDAAP
jgi:hypothetical protein